MGVRFRADGREFRAEAFLFDKDGTLFTFDHWIRVMKERARRLSQSFSLSSEEGLALSKFLGAVRERPGEWGIIPLPRPEAEEATAQFLAQILGASPAEVLPVVKKVFAEIDQEFPFHRHLQPTPGAEELLLGIKRGGGKVGVVTHDVAAAARLHFRALGWEDLIDAVVGLDVCPVKKPAPDPVVKACTLLWANPTRSVMIGDTANDLAAGRAAGCSAVLGVLTGLGTPAELRPLSDAVLPNLLGIELG